MGNPLGPRHSGQLAAEVGLRLGLAVAGDFAAPWVMLGEGVGLAGYLGSTTVLVLPSLPRRNLKADSDWGSHSSILQATVSRLSSNLAGILTQGLKPEGEAGMPGNTPRRETPVPRDRFRLRVGSALLCSLRNIGIGTETAAEVESEVPGRKHCTADERFGIGAAPGRVALIR